MVTTSQRSGYIKTPWRAYQIVICIAIAVVGVACSPEPQTQSVATNVEIRPQPADTRVDKPTIVRVVLRISGNRVELLSAKPKRGDTFERDKAVVAAEALAGKLRILRYQAIDSTGTAFEVGTFTVPVVAEAEYLDPNVAHRIVRQEQPLSSATVVVAIKYSDALASLEIAELKPQADVPSQRWSSKQIGRVDLHLPSSKAGGVK